MTRTMMSVGFLFSDDLQNVLLLRKARPEWQAGKLNGVGGHSEETDTTLEDTMRRECLEEVGVDIAKSEWLRVVEMYNLAKDGDWMVVAFCAVAPLVVLEKAVSDTRDRDEKAEIVPVNALHVLDKIVGNVRWLVPMAIDRLVNPDTFKRSTVEYGP